MSDFIRKALGMFVEFDEPANPRQPKPANPSSPKTREDNNLQSPVYNGQLSQQEIEKFTKHFNDLFDQSNLPGPDYYEFSKMMHMLETPIPDENTRISAVFASLSIQGLTKEKVIETAKEYCTIIENDKAAFDKAAADKAQKELEGRKYKIETLEKKIADSSEMIRKLTQDITDAQTQIGTLKNEMIQAETKITASKSGFNAAYQAMYNKISSDIQKIGAVLK